MGYRRGKFVCHVTRTNFHLPPQTGACIRPLIQWLMQVSVHSSNFDYLLQVSVNFSNFDYLLQVSVHSSNFDHLLQILEKYVEVKRGNEAEACSIGTGTAGLFGRATLAFVMPNNGFLVRRNCRQMVCLHGLTRVASEPQMQLVASEQQIGLQVEMSCIESEHLTVSCSL